MGKGLIRLLAFFNKEINEVRRQPRLVLSLLLGPFLILLIFGIGYQGDRPVLRTALVVSPEQLNDPQLEQIKRSIAANFTLSSIGSDVDAAMTLLNTGAVDVVEVLPPDMKQQVMSGKQLPVDFRYNEINPLNEQWIQYLAYAQVNELNRAVLLEATRALQGEATNSNASLAQLRDQIDAVNSNAANVNKTQMQQSIRQARAASVLLASPLAAAQMTSSDKTQLAQLQQNLDSLDRALANGTLEQQRDQLVETRAQIVQIEEASKRFSQIPAESLVSPLQQQYQNIRGKPYDFMTYYAPSVIALILQHIAVTLGGLSLVREKLLGATEFYGVAPVSMVQVLVGKYLGYTLFIGIISAALMGLMVFVLGVPFTAHIGLFIGVLLLFTLASLGVGFLLSSISSSDSQAVQLSMLVLLLSIFFSGFFLPLDNFSTEVRYLSYALPLTHGISSFQALILRDIAPSSLVWIALSAITVVTFILVMLTWRRQFRRVS